MIEKNKLIYKKDRLDERISSAENNPQETDKLIQKKSNLLKRIEKLENTIRKIDELPLPFKCFRYLGVFLNTIITIMLLFILGG